MKRQRLMLITARFFAGAALIFFYLTSCTNYWLHAVTCGSDNNTQSAETQLSDRQMQKTPTDNATELKSGTDSRGTARFLTGRDESSPMGSSMPENGTLQHQRKKRYSDYYLFSEHTLLLKDNRVTYHHEGFTWRCSFTDKEAGNQHSKFITIYQPPVKCCVHAFYSPFPSNPEIINAEFQSSLVYRKLWSALMFLGVIIITIGFICIIYKACRQKHEMYKTVGVIFLIGGICFTLSIIMYACWISAISQMIAKEIANCKSANGNTKYGVDYGWSFMAAPFAVLFSVIAGGLFIKLSAPERSESGEII
ncbi:transmembrane protein 182-like [Amblyraja radiata]|uniref:transmembrane protein 182-like n=1 Tax=Amblyraja radiata TaxID=386614 RepID=UPI001401C7A2|nr:transmembrane protein 182-like [Amblyraja radiata]